MTTVAQSKRTMALQRNESQEGILMVEINGATELGMLEAQSVKLLPSTLSDMEVDVTPLLSQTNTSTHTNGNISSNTLWPMIALAISQTIYSGWHVVGARVMKSVPYVHVISFTVVRQILSYFVLAVAALVKEGRVPLPSCSQYHYRYKLLLGGICGGSLMPLLYLSGLVCTSPTIAAVWDGPMLPVLVFIITLLLGIEKINKVNPIIQVMSLIITVLGSIFVLMGDFHYHKATHEEYDVQQHDAKYYEFINGNLLLAAMVSCYAITCLVQRSMAMSGSSCGVSTSSSSSGSNSSSASLENHATLTGTYPSSVSNNDTSATTTPENMKTYHSSPSYPPLTVTSWICGIGAVCNVALVFMFGTSVPGGVSLYQVYEEMSQALQESHFFCIGLLYAVCGMTVFTNVAVSYSSRYLESSVITLFCAGQPPLTVLLERVFFGKPITEYKVMGMLMVACGMWFFTASKNNTIDGKFKTCSDTLASWRGTDHTKDNENDGDESKLFQFNNGFLTSRFDQLRLRRKSPTKIKATGVTSGTKETPDMNKNRPPASTDASVI